MRDLTYRFMLYLLVGSMAPALQGQLLPQRSGEPSPDSSTTKLVQKLDEISGALAATRRQLEQYQQQMQELQRELAQVREQLGAATASSQRAAAASEEAATGTDLKERVEALEAQAKIQDQIKVESSSKYPVHVFGLVLFNSFINGGGVDNIDLPSVATGSAYGASSGSVGAGMRQTILGIEGYGPRIAGARTYANVSVDFFGGIPSSDYGTSAGIVRMRTAGIRFDWTRDSLEVGMEPLFISPLSPTSYATVAEPGLAWAGNLWTWAPQLRFAYQLPDSDHWKLEAGLWDPPAAGYYSANVPRVPSPGERAEQPAYETRISYASQSEGQGLQIGIGGYYSRQSYSYSDANEYPVKWSNDSWALTADWRVPVTHRFELSGEGYRGRSLGGLGGGVYKDILYGTNPISGAYTILGLNDIGGWTQFKSRFGRALEANAAIGLDNGFANDFHSIILPPDASATELLARNRMVVGNLIFKPKTYFIVSPEYRRISTWPIYGDVATANVYTLSFGYQF